MFINPTMGKLWCSSSSIQKKRKNINRKTRYTHIACTQVPRCTWKIWKPYYTFIYCTVIAHEAELPDSGGCCRAPVIRPTVFPFKRTLWGASGSHTLIKSRHLIDTLCKVLCRWTKRTDLFYSPVDRKDHHLPASCVLYMLVPSWERV